jgi:hypothetical protein
MAARRVLSIDGGGVKGVFAAAFLASCEEALGQPIGRYFDLIAGTSTGGIIALGLGLGYSAQEMLELYRALGPTVFSRPRGRLRWCWLPRHDPSGLRRCLEEKFGDRTLGDASTRLLVPSFDLDSGRVHVFKTAHHERLEKDYTRKAVDVALATTAAPTYFPCHRDGRGLAFVDGRRLGQQSSGLCGCGGGRGASVVDGGCQHPERELHRRGSRLLAGSPEAPARATFWALRAADLFCAGQSSGAVGMAQHLVGHDRVFRVEPSAYPGRFTLDGLAEMPALEGLGTSEGRTWLPRLRGTFFTQAAEPFRPAWPRAAQV